MRELGDYVDSTDEKINEKQRTDLTLKINFLFFVFIFCASFFYREGEQKLFFLAGFLLGLNTLLSKSSVPSLNLASKFILVTITSIIPFAKYSFSTEVTYKLILLYWSIIPIITAFFIFRPIEFLAYLFLLFSLATTFYVYTEMDQINTRLYLQYIGQMGLASIVFWSIKTYLYRREQVYLKFQSLLSVILHNSPDFMVLIRPDGKIEYMNNFRGEKSISNIIGTSIYDYFDKPVGDIYKQNIEKCLQSLKTQEFDLIYDLRKIGANHNFYIRAVPLLENNIVKNVIVIATDVTWGRLKIKKEVDSIKLESLGLLAAGIAHDFNNILQGVQLATNRIKKHSNKKIKGYIDGVQLYCTRGNDLVRSILSYCEMPQGKTLSHINIAELTRDTVRMVKSAMTKNISIDMHIDSEDFFIKGEKSQFRQIVLNLLTNAIKATRENGEIQISITKNINNVILKVTDRGIGIPKEHLDKVFIPFFTTNYSGSQKGTGIGLSVVKNFVEEFHGEITVTSEKDIGTTFSVAFTLVDPPIEKNQIRPSHQTVKPETSSPQDSTIKNIVIVDDESQYLSFLQEDLADLNIDARIFSNPAEAIDYINKNVEQIDAIVTDYSMPKITGIQVIEQAYAKSNHLKFVLVTGFGGEVNSDNIANKNVKILFKPYSIDDLIQSLREA